MDERFESHPTPEQFEALANGTLGAAERRRLIHHIMAGCRQCRSAAATHWPFGAGRGKPRRPACERRAEDGLDETLNRVLARVELQQCRAEEERRKAPQLWREVESLPFEQCRLLLSNGGKFHTWAFAYHLSEHAEDAGFHDAARAIELAQLSLIVAERVDADSSQRATVRDLLAHCWATLGNAHRIACDLDRAEEALAIAGEWLSEGAGDPLEEARHLDLLAELRSAQRRFQESLDLRSRAATRYQRLGDKHLHGRTLVAQAKTLDDMQEHVRSVNTLKTAIPLLDADREPLAVLAAQHNLALSLNELGRSDEALALVRHARPLYRKVGGALNLLRLRWLEGKIERQRGHHLASCRALLEVRNGFLARDMGYEAALVTLDLALTHLETGNLGEVRRLAGEAIPVFESLGIRREVFAALLALREAARKELLSMALVKELYARASRKPASPR